MQKGDKFETEFEINERTYFGFMEVFNDRNPLHTNDDFAREKGFESKVMHGNILNGFVSFFVGECLPIKNVIIQTQEIKYFKPAYLNDKLVFQAEVYEFFESVKTIEMKFLFKKTTGTKIASGKMNLGII